ncbi:MAG: hypothetical protein PUC51_00765 [Ruminococcus sp.]|nr:hypothetical protein [Ruminococcus sp.]
MSADVQSIKELHRGIIEDKTQEELDALLWEAVLAYQGQPLHTLSGLEFSYTVKHKKNGEYSGELLVSRKETSKTLTRSSVLLAFHKVLEATEVISEGGEASFQLPTYRGPKAIGQIFGISYIFSLFLEFGLIRVSENGRRRKTQK